ncbi:restriction endonuclease type II-like protein [Vibrio phage 1.123.O._10N.286.48.F3]|nr:restriction endonuclease type II-like protein [Vibrio phage 1.123.O._10N.286.48.F3]
MSLFTNSQEIMGHASSVLGFNAMQVEQQSIEWEMMRLGVITCSRAKDILSGRTSRGYRGYVYELCTEISTKAPSRSKVFRAKPLEHGNEFEPQARGLFSGLTGKKVDEVGFLYKDESMRVGLSPDGVIYEEDTGLELKCPWGPENHWEFIDTGLIPAADSDKWKKQVQMSMWVTGCDNWYFATFEPEMTRKGLMHGLFDRDEKMMKQFDERIPQLIEDIDSLLSRAGYKFGDQWKN